MVTVRTTLTDQENMALAEIAKKTGKTQGELVREALREFINHFDNPDRLSLLRQARGMWKDRDDLPSLEELRGEFDRLDS